MHIAFVGEHQECQTDIETYTQRHTNHMQKKEKNYGEKCRTKVLLDQINCDYVLIESVLLLWFEWNRFSAFETVTHSLVSCVCNYPIGERRRCRCCQYRCRRHRCYVFPHWRCALVRKFIIMMIIIVFCSYRFGSQFSLASEQTRKILSFLYLSPHTSLYIHMLAHIIIIIIFMFSSLPIAHVVEILTACDYTNCVRRIETRSKRFYTFQFYIQSK